MLRGSTEKILADSRCKRIPDFIRLKNESGSSEDVYYSVAYTGFPDEFKAIAEKELNETEENKRVGIRSLRDFLKRERMFDVDDHTLIRILRCSKYNFKKAEAKLKKFLKIHRFVLEKVADLDLKTVEMIIEDKGIGMLPYRDKQGRVVVFTRPDAMNDDLYSMDNVMVTGLALAMVILAWPISSIAGYAYIAECKFRSVPSYLSLLRSMQKHVWYFLDLSVRVGRVDVINEHFLSKWFINFVRPFVSYKVFNRITCFGTNLQNLQKFYHPDLLPKEFGGRAEHDPELYKDIALDWIRQLKAEGQALKEENT